MNQLKEVKINSEVVFSGNLLTVCRDSVRLPNQAQATREYVVHPGASAVVPIRDDGKIIMVRQYRYPLGKEVLEIPAGKLDSGETPQQCVIRELAEETGYQAAEITHLSSIYTTPGFTNEVIHLYVARQLTATKQHLDEDEFLAVEAYTPAELKALLQSGELADAKTVLALFQAGVL